MSEFSENCELMENIDFDTMMKNKKFDLFIKRAFDILVSWFGLVVLFPFFIVIAIMIKIDSKGSVFFRQERIGRGGKPFRIFKFRTMITDAEAQGLQLTVGADSRVTKVGQFLRKTKIDELPQLLNVLIGQMSFVGPRPEVRRYVELYSEYQRNILRIRPGITEEASIVYRNENEVLANSSEPEQTYINEIMPEKIALNMNYMINMSLWYDLKLIFKTIMILFD